MNRSDLPSLLADIAACVQPFIGQGKVADYIPALADVDTRQFAMALVTTDGQCFSNGDDQARFTIQSVSKAMTLTMGCSAMVKPYGNGWVRNGNHPVPRLTP